MTMAVESDSLDMLELLLLDGRVDPREDNSHCLVEAVRKHDDGMVALLLDDGRADPTTHQHGILNLYISTEIMKLLIADGRCQFNTYGMAPVLMAIQNRNVALLELLLQHPNIDVRDYEHECLEAASGQGHVRIMELLLKKGKLDPHIGESSALRTAVNKENVPMVKLLMEDGRSNPGACCNEALRSAVRTKNADILRLLLKSKRCNPKVDNDCLLRSAVSGNNIEIARLLLCDRRAYPAVNDNEFLVHAIRRGHVDMVRLLLGFYAVDPSTHNNLVLRISMEKGYASIVHLLVKDTRMECVIQDVNQPLLYRAVEGGHARIVQAILNTGVERVCDEMALCQAILRNNITVTRLLLKGRPIKEKLDGLTDAVKREQEAMVDILLQEKDVAEELKRAYTRLMMLAVERGNDNMVRMLGKHLRVTDAHCNYAYNTTTMRTLLLEMQKTQRPYKTMLHYVTKST
jgi:ankyrin repeat protein